MSNVTSAVSAYLDTAPAEEISQIRTAKPKRLQALLAQLRGQTPEKRIAQAAAVFGVEPAEITGVERAHKIARARHVAAWLLRQDGMSYPQIGRALGYRDHTTIMHSVEVVEAERAADAAVRDALDGMVAG